MIYDRKIPDRKMKVNPTFPLRINFRPMRCRLLAFFLSAIFLSSASAAAIALPGGGA